MKLLRLVFAAVAVSLLTAACGSDVTGPAAPAPASAPSLNQGTYGSGG